jgi:imidazoleglycerol-phosphate dehydratase
MTGSGTARTGRVERVTRETDVRLQIALDGTGAASVSTGVGFLDHMLELFAAHGRFDLEVQAAGDLHTGGHHTVEDVGICLGSAFDQALGDRVSIVRYGDVHLPMDEALALVAVDISGRPLLSYEVELPPVTIGGFDTDLLPEFLQAVVNNARLTLHVRKLAGTNPHHVVEAVFKGVGRSLGTATRLDPRVVGIPSTKGLL